MEKHKNTSEGGDPLDIRHFLAHPHDKFVRSLLQYRVSALQIIEYALSKEIFDLLDLQTLELTNASFIDEKLQISLADICYEGQTQTEKPFRICLLFEHKSEFPVKGLYEQLSRYINNIWLEDQKQNRPTTLSIPILIYHGSVPLGKELPENLFPDAPPELLRFVPRFDYVLLDLASMSESDIDKMEFHALKNVFLALKYSRNEKYLKQNWKKVIIFASEFKDDKAYHYIIQATITYMISVSKTVEQNLEKMDTVLSPEETVMVRPFFIEKYFQEGMQEGEQKGMLRILYKFIQNNPNMSDLEIAQSFDVDIKLVKMAREQ